MKIMSVDFGDARTGIAMCDKTEMLASPIEVIHEKDFETCIRKVADVAIKHGAEEVVVGYPKNMNNTIGERALKTLEFKDLLERTFKLEVLMQDERLSTVSAENFLIKNDISRKKRKQVIDKMASQVILQSFLDRYNSMKEGK